MLARDETLLKEMVNWIILLLLLSLDLLRDNDGRVKGLLPWRRTIEGVVELFVLWVTINVTTVGVTIYLFMFALTFRRYRLRWRWILSGYLRKGPKFEDDCVRGGCGGVRSVTEAIE